MTNFKDLDEKWQKRWSENSVFKSKIDPKKKKFYCLEMYPYPSGSGLHMGHVRNYAIGDAYARFMRMNNYNVIYPMGYDSFGMPAENAAIKHKIKPKEWTESNMALMKRQQKALGLSYDWDRTIFSHDPEYYKWNQWIFIQLFKKGLAYRKGSNTNWCSSCNTVLANEQVQDGKCWRCSQAVTIKEMDQWFFKITDYAEELLKDIDSLEWPERVKTMQRNWIGKSQGTLVNFKIKETDEVIPVFTTRPDTLFGVTFMVFAPEHPKVMELVRGTEYEEAVAKFVTQAFQNRFERAADDKEKEGFFIGKHAINPVNGEEIPIFIANFVLMDYGTGFIMAVPTHDQRDFEFAKKYDIPLRVVINPKDGWTLDEKKMTRAFVDSGVLVNSEHFNGMDNIEAIDAINDWLEEQGYGKRTTQFKLRDWLISRQRYWGTPIPIIYCDKCGATPANERDLPILLPDDVEFTGEGNPLEYSASFTHTNCPRCGNTARRETDTMDTFVDSSWYFLRYCSPDSKDAPFASSETDYWMPVDQYIGGIEHAVMHLLYARFLTKALRDMGLTKISEPFSKLLCQGMVLKDGEAMSKSKGNVIDPNEIISIYGADTARVFILFAALPEKELEWSDKGVESTNKFLAKNFTLCNDPCERNGSEQTDRQIISRLNRTIQKVTDQYKKFELSLAIGSIMEFVNYIQKMKNEYGMSAETWKSAKDSIILMLCPIAPHICEELWSRAANPGFCSNSPWPSADKSLIDAKSEAAEIIVESTRKDILRVLNLLGFSNDSEKNPRHITLILAAAWKRDLFRLIKTGLDKQKDQMTILKDIMSKDEFRQHGKDVARIVPSIVKNRGKIPDVLISSDEENIALTLSIDRLKKEFDCDIVIEKEENSNHDKARNAIPAKPAIVIS